MSRKILIVLMALVVIIALQSCSTDGASAGDTSQPLNFKYNGISMTPGDAFEGISDKLGEPDGYYEAASCAFDGKDKIYTYGSLQISVSPMDGVDTIYMITLLDDSLSTPEGIYVGTEKSAVLSAYGSGYGSCVDKGSSLTYNSGKTNLVFLVRDNCVTSIQYRYVDAVING